MSGDVEFSLPAELPNGDVIAPGALDGKQTVRLFIGEPGDPGRINLGMAEVGVSAVGLTVDANRDQEGDYSWPRFDRPLVVQTSFQFKVAGGRRAGRRLFRYLSGMSRLEFALYRARRYFLPALQRSLAALADYRIRGRR